VNYLNWKRYKEKFMENKTDYTACPKNAVNFPVA
jgi:hypothetical protein